MSMPGKTSIASYLSGGGIALVGKLRCFLTGLTLDDWAVIIGITIAVATFFLNAYWQRRRTRAIENAAQGGLVIMRGKK